jgi:hypothetical protein
MWKFTAIACFLDMRFNIFFIFSVTFRLIEKSPKDQADGKCSRTSLLPPTVGIAHARGNIVTSRPEPYRAWYNK